MEIGRTARLVVLNRIRRDFHFPKDDDQNLLRRRQNPRKSCSDEYQVIRILCIVMVIKWKWIFLFPLLSSPRFRSPKNLARELPESVPHFANFRILRRNRARGHNNQNHTNHNDNRYHYDNNDHNYLTDTNTNDHNTDINDIAIIRPPQAEADGSRR